MAGAALRRFGCAILVVVGVAGCHSGSSSAVAAQRDHSPAASSHSPSHRPTPTFSPARSLVSQAHWDHYPEGWRLVVMPSIYGRNHSPEAVSQTLTEALRLAPPPLHLTHTMRRSLYNQLECHANFAPRKPLWDLESWRPNVGYYRTVEALCNPGGGF